MLRLKCLIPENCMLTKPVNPTNTLQFSTSTKKTLENIRAKQQTSTDQLRALKPSYH